MRIEDDTIVVMETGKYFELAESGAKPNTQQFASPPMNFDLEDNRKRIQYIRVYNEHQLEFTRQVTDLTCVGGMIGAHLWVVSWKHDDSPTRKGPRWRGSRSRDADESS